MVAIEKEFIKCVSDGVEYGTVHFPDAIEKLYDNDVRIVYVPSKYFTSLVLHPSVRTESLRQSELGMTYNAFGKMVKLYGIEFTCSKGNFWQFGTIELGEKLCSQ